jgi:hypothetical protein
VQNSAVFRKKTLQGIPGKFRYYNIQDVNMNENRNMSVNVTSSCTSLACVLKGEPTTKGETSKTTPIALVEHLWLQVEPQWLQGGPQWLQSRVQ